MVSSSINMYLIGGSLILILLISIGLYFIFRKNDEKSKDDKKQENEEDKKNKDIKMKYQSIPETFKNSLKKYFSENFPNLSENDIMMITNDRYNIYPKCNENSKNLLVDCDFNYYPWICSETVRTDCDMLKGKLLNIKSGQDKQIIDDWSKPEVPGLSIPCSRIFPNKSIDDISNKWRNDEFRITEKTKSKIFEKLKKCDWNKNSDGSLKKNYEL